MPQDLPVQFPITATVFPVRTFGGCAVTHPFWNAYSMIIFSLSLICHRISFKAQVHAASQSAGQTLPVNSGKQCVFSETLHMPVSVPAMRSDHWSPAPDCEADIRCSCLRAGCRSGRTARRSPCSVRPVSAVLLQVKF